MLAAVFQLRIEFIFVMCILGYFCNLPFLAFITITTTNPRTSASKAKEESISPEERRKRLLNRVAQIYDCKATSKKTKPEDRGEKSRRPTAP